MLWTGPWDLSSINSDVKYGVTFLPGYNGNHETISGPDSTCCSTTPTERCETAFDVHDLADLGQGRTCSSRSPTGDLPLRKSETKLPGYQTFLKKYPAEKVFVRQPRQRQARAAEHREYAEVSTAIGQMVQSVLLGQAEPRTP